MLACRLPEDYSESAGVMVENPALEAFTAEEHIMQYPIQQQEAWHPTICSTAAKSSIKKDEKEEKTTPNRDNKFLLSGTCVHEPMHAQTHLCYKCWLYVHQI